MVVIFSYDKEKFMIKKQIICWLGKKVAVKYKPVSSSFSVTVNSLVSCLEHEGAVVQAPLLQVIYAVPDIRYPVRHWYTAILVSLYGPLVITVPPVIAVGSEQPWKDTKNTKFIPKEKYWYSFSQFNLSWEIDFAIFDIAYFLDRKVKVAYWQRVRGSFPTSDPWQFLTGDMCLVLFFPGKEDWSLNCCWKLR